ncbi:extensin-like [Drosophila subpulchrella]|uniref:extensin-like n=1 Tax=Drosophila subpulchrella TaxID=1486046 RepID=UPI0018A1AFA7|nr:extensin-like [Drosophila subpulchrella]
MSTRVTRSEARRMMEAHQPSGGSSPGQGWSAARPTRTSRRISGRGVPDPVISSDSDVELVEDPRVEQRRWRLRKAFNRADGRIPTGAAQVEWASGEPPQDQTAPVSHAEAVVAATWEFRRKCEARGRNEERRLKEMEESPEWQAQLRMAEEEETQLWENPGYPPTPRYAPEPGTPPQEVADDWAPSPPRWLPEIPPTPRYEGSPRTRTFVAEGVRWRQQTVVWTWPEGPAEETAATEEPRIWEECGPRVSPLDPRTRGRPEQWAPPTPSTGPTTPTPTGSAISAEPLERGPWVWPEPVENGRPPLKRQHSAPEVSEVVTRPKLSRTVSAPEGQRWREIAEPEWPEGIAEAPVVQEARILGGRRSVRVWREGRAFRVRLGLAGTRVFEEQK